MPKYLIRGGKVPYERIETKDYLSQNIMGTNSGNFIYLHGIVRTLMTDRSVEFQSTRYRYNYSAKEIARLNSECDGFIIPLADAFRDSFVPELKGLTKLVRELKCPSYVIGVGVSATAEKKFADGHFGFEDEVRDFVNAVLEKSGVIGVRGEQTGRFLETLGFKEGEHFMVIGCPSLYTFGKRLEIRDTDKGFDCRAAFNMSHSPKGRDFLYREAKKFQNIIYVPQLMAELQTLYWGADFKDYLSGKECDPLDPTFPSSLSHPLYKEDRVRFFVNVNDWVDFMKTRDLVFGTRLHGNITATISGAPSILMTKDIRMRELAKFHGLTSVSTDELTNYKDITELIAEADFHSPEKKQAENFENYLDFLHKNGLKTIYDDDHDRTDAPFDELIIENGVTNDIRPAVKASASEIANRMLSCVDHLRARRKEINANLAKKDSKIKTLEKELGDEKKKLKEQTKKLAEESRTNERLRRIIGCRSVQMTIKARNIFLPDEKKIRI